LLEIDGEKGAIRLDAGYKLTIQNGDDENVQDVSPPVLDWAERPWHNIQESVVAIEHHFLECLASNTETETSRADNLKTLTLVEAAYRSAAQACSVNCADL